MRLRPIQMSDSLLVGSLLALSGGVLDAYTYLFRGQVFANAITGNLVLLGLSAARGDGRRALLYLLPVLAYGSGVYLTEALRARLRDTAYHWRQYVLAAEMAIAAAAALVPAGRWNPLVNATVSFLCAMQTEAFRKTREGLPLATTMCTGNLRNGAEKLYHAVSRRDASALRQGLRYFYIIAFFVLGATVCFSSMTLLGEKAILLAEGPWLAALLLLSVKPAKE